MDSYYLKHTNGIRVKENYDETRKLVEFAIPRYILMCIPMVYMVYF